MQQPAIKLRRGVMICITQSAKSTCEQLRDGTKTAQYQKYFTFTINIYTLTYGVIT